MTPTELADYLEQCADNPAALLARLRHELQKDYDDDFEDDATALAAFFQSLGLTASPGADWQSAAPVGVDTATRLRSLAAFLNNEAALLARLGHLTAKLTDEDEMDSEDSVSFFEKHAVDKIVK